VTESPRFLLAELERFGAAKSNPEQIAPFIALVAACSDFTTSLVPVGKGEFLAVKMSR